MSKIKSSLKNMGLQPYSGKLDPVSAATGMQAARLNAVDLVETSQCLLDCKKYHHSVACSILAIEECGKVPIILSIFLEAGDLSGKWKGFRLHTYKGAFLNPAIVSVSKATFPDLDEEVLSRVADGPSPEYLDATKQLVWYADCFQSAEGAVWHLPRNVDWIEKAHAILAEAKALAYQLRDYPPAELAIWYKHAYQWDKKKNMEDVKGMMKALRDELFEKGFIKEDWWNLILNGVDDIFEKQDKEMKSGQQTRQAADGSQSD